MKNTLKTGHKISDFQKKHVLGEALASIWPNLLSKTISALTICVYGGGKEGHIERNLALKSMANTFRCTTHRLHILVAGAAGNVLSQRGLSRVNRVCGTH